MRKKGQSMLRKFDAKGLKVIPCAVIGELVSGLSTMTQQCALSLHTLLSLAFDFVHVAKAHIGQRCAATLIIWMSSFTKRFT